MRTITKRSRKSNRVSWASVHDLCQVRLFCSEDCPAKVGLKSQDDPQAMTSRALRSDPTAANDMPPGFERGFAVNISGLEPSYVPQVQWKCPPKFLPCRTWQVASGEESEEVKHQKLREMRELEAVYPRFSAIPPCPSVFLEVENGYYDDSQTPLVPLTPIEEEELADTPDDIATPVNSNTTTIRSEPQSSMPQVPLPSEPLTSKCSSSFLRSLGSSQLPVGKLPNLGADVLAATSVALAAIMKSTERRSLIDTELLIKILSDPKMIQGLMNNGPTTNTAAGSSISELSTVSPSVPLSSPMLDLHRPLDEKSFNLRDGVRATLNAPPHQQDAHQVSRFLQVATPVVSMSTPEPLVSLPGPLGGNLFTIPNQVRSSVSAAIVQPNTTTIPTFAAKEPARPVKDINYYKNLIRQHGGEREENKDYFHTQNGENCFQLEVPKPLQNFKLREQKPKNSKPCVYFKTSKGCRNGANCPFQHDVSTQWQPGKVMENHRAKRMKLNGEINGKMLVGNY